MRSLGTLPAGRLEGRPSEPSSGRSLRYCYWSFHRFISSRFLDQARGVTAGPVGKFAISSFAFLPFADQASAREQQEDRLFSAGLARDRGLGEPLRDAAREGGAAGCGAADLPRHFHSNLPDGGIAWGFHFPGG